MDRFESLLNIAEKLLGPQGCPWDRKQTFLSLQPYVLEEAHEVIEAVDADDDGKIVEELGDLLYTIVFYGKLAEQTGRFSILDIIRGIEEKLIRRHPHVFGEVKVADADEVLKNWEQIKRQEKGESKPQNQLIELPPTLPAMSRAQKIIRKMQRAGSPLVPKEEQSASEKEIGDQMLALVMRAESAGVDAESALRRSLSRLEQAFLA
jgi:tetrapyrrole methylase family protein / MazG family protein